jgi:uncharacterized protein (DUF433 family)
MCYTLKLEEGSFGGINGRTTQMHHRKSKSNGGQTCDSGNSINGGIYLGYIGPGRYHRECLAEYPGLVKEDIQACLLFASRSLQDIAFMPLSVDG